VPVDDFALHRRCLSGAVANVADPAIKGVSNSFPLRASKSTFCHDVQNYDEGVSVMAVLI
jgi:hypothetical protein